MPDRSNLPASLTSFVGREQETAEVVGLLGAARLLTLTGAGGAGKTRLALRVAETRMDSYGDGVWLVELAPVASDGLVAKTLSAALRLHEQPRRAPVDVLTEWLRPRHVLLVLDNCEHLVQTCANLVDTLLRACHRLTVLATSREPLGVPGEVNWRVPPLSLPDRTEPITADGVLASEAGHLFVDRAIANRPDFVLSDANAVAVEEVCRRLDGIPLAIELAAGRVNLLAVHDIAARLDDRFRLLTAGTRTSLPRHRTLRAVVDWSYALLTPEEQALFCSLAVFAGGFSLEAAESVCDATLDQLAGLVDRSLVQVEPTDTGSRYRLLETLRHFAAEQLSATDRVASLRDRHLAWFLGLAERAAPQLLGPHQTLWLKQLESEHDNLRLALQRSLDSGDAQSVARLGIALWEFWYIRGHLSEGRRWLDLASERSADVPRDVLGRLLRAAGNLASYCRDRERAMPLWQASLEISREVGDLEAVAACLFNMAAERAERGDYAAAERLFEESIPLMHETGDSYGVALALVEQGYLAAHQSRYGQSEELLERAFVRFTELGDKRRAARATMRRGVVAILRGDTFRGQELCRRGLAGFRDIDFLPGIGDCLEALASVEGIHGHGRQAAYLFGAAEALQERLGQAPSDAPADRTLRERGQRALARHLDSAAQATARATGRSAPLSRVVSVALLPAAEDFDHTAGAHGQSLTRREYEVAALIAAGLSDGQIAERLVVSRRTAHAHVRNILGKLGFASRVEIATWAIGHGLAHPAASI